MNKRTYTNSRIEITPCSSNYLASVINEHLLDLTNIILNIELPEGIKIENNKKRTWNPMDKTLPPNCPFTDLFTSSFQINNYKINTQLELVHWNENELSNSTYKYIIFEEDNLLISIRGYSETETSKVERLKLKTKMHGKKQLDIIAFTIRDWLII